MISKKISWLLVLAVIPVLSGFFMTSRASADQSIPRIPATGAIMPADSGSASPSIIPIDNSKIMARHREMLAGMGKNKDKTGAGHDMSGSDRDMGDMEKMGADRTAPGPSETTDRDMGSMRKDSPEPMGRDKDIGDPSMDRGSNTDPTFRYVIWPFGRSGKVEKPVDKDPQGQPGDNDHGADRSRMDKPSGGGSGMMDKNEGMLLAADESSESSDLDMAEDRNQDSDSE
ncbi:MAG: hypothetical protein ABFD97_20000 [Syntrophobacter sp.]